MCRSLLACIPKYGQFACQFGGPDLDRQIRDERDSVWDGCSQLSVTDPK